MQNPFTHSGYIKNAQITVPHVLLGMLAASPMLIGLNWAYQRNFPATLGGAAGGALGGALAGTAINFFRPAKDNKEWFKNLFYSVLTSSLTAGVVGGALGIAHDIRRRLD